MTKQNDKIKTAAALLAANLPSDNKPRTDQQWIFAHQEAMVKTIAELTGGETNSFAAFIKLPTGEIITRQEKVIARSTDDYYDIHRIAKGDCERVVTSDIGIAADGSDMTDERKKEIGEMLCDLHGEICDDRIKAERGMFLTFTHPGLSPIWRAMKELS